MDRSLFSVINSRKKRKDVKSDSDGEYDMAPPAKSRRSSISLGLMLKPTQIPQRKYDAIQKVIWDQDSTIVERGRKINECGMQIHDLRNELAETLDMNERYGDRLLLKNRQIDELEERLQSVKSKQDHKAAAARGFREREQYYEEFMEDQIQLMDVGRKVLAEKTHQADRLTAEKHQLQALVGERDNTISALHEKIQHLCMASADELAAIAIESQAERTLGMVKGLQEDIAQRNLVIKNYKSKNTALIAANESYKIENQEMISTNSALKDTDNAVAKQAEEANRIINYQGVLIERVMEENARLGANEMIIVGMEAASR